MGPDAAHVRRGGGPGRLGECPHRRGGRRLAHRVRARHRRPGRVGPARPPRTQCPRGRAPGGPRAASPVAARSRPPTDRRPRPRPPARAARGPRGAHLLRLPGQLRRPRRHARRADGAAARGPRRPPGRGAGSARQGCGYRPAERRGRHHPAAHRDDQRTFRSRDGTLRARRRSQPRERRRRHAALRGAQHALGAEGPAIRSPRTCISRSGRTST